MSSRRVNRSGARPTYRPPYSRQRTSRRRLRWPRFTWLASGFWLRLAAISTVLLLILVVIARGTAITKLEVEGNHTLRSAQLTNLMQEGLDDQWFGRNLLLANTAALADYLDKHELGLKQVTIQRRLPHTLAITVAERQPTLNWKTNGILYLLDRKSVV